MGDMEMREGESRISYKQRMLQRRLEQTEAEAEVLRQGVASYRAYQEHELREVRVTHYLGLLAPSAASIHLFVDDDVCIRIGEARGRAGDGRRV